MASWNAWVALVLMGIMLAEMATNSEAASRPNYGDALSKSILFFEGQRSGKLPPSQRMTWRKDSALLDGIQMGVSKSFLHGTFKSLSILLSVFSF